MQIFICIDFFDIDMFGYSFVLLYFLIPIYTDIFVRIDIDTNVTLWFPYKYPYLLPNCIRFTTDQQKQTLNTQTIRQNFRQAEL